MGTLWIYGRHCRNIHEYQYDQPQRGIRIPTTEAELSTGLPADVGPRGAAPHPLSPRRGRTEAHVHVSQQTTHVYSRTHPRWGEP